MHTNMHISEKHNFEDNDRERKKEEESNKK